MGKYDHLLRDETGRCINPETGSAFKYGEMYNGLKFQQHRKINKKYFPEFCNYEKRRKSQTILQRKYKVREMKNKRLPYNISLSLLCAAKKRAKKHCSNISITLKEILKKVFLRRDELTCLLIELDFPGSPFSPSLDRIHSFNSDYISENTRLITRQLNGMRNMYSDEETVLNMKGFVKGQERKKRRSSFNDADFLIFLDEKQKEIILNRKDNYTEKVTKKKINQIIQKSNFFRAINLRSQAVKRTKERQKGTVTINSKEIEKKINFGRCEISGLLFELDHPGSPFSPSLDRLHPQNYDYDNKNSALVTKQVNDSKNMYYDDETSLQAKAFILAHERKTRCRSSSFNDIYDIQKLVKEQEKIIESRKSEGKIYLSGKKRKITDCLQ